ncbi:MAG: hypothetical protein HGA65_07935 [Oscillochloris sp.]|nr:hypothetical protein [Oscillochloris sp.]
MTINLVQGDTERLTLRYIPLLAWAFIGLILYGIGQVVLGHVGGLAGLGSSKLFGLAALLAIAIATMLAAGQLVVCHFDWGDDEVRIVRYGLHGRAAHSRRLSEVVGIDIRVLRRTQHRVELRLRSGERLPLTPYYVLALSTGGVARLGARLGVELTTVQQQASLRR